MNLLEIEQVICYNQSNRKRGWIYVEEASAEIL